MSPLASPLATPLMTPLTSPLATLLASPLVTPLVSQIMSCENSVRWTTTATRLQWLLLYFEKNISAIYHSHALYSTCTQHYPPFKSHASSTWHTQCHHNAMHVLNQLKSSTFKATNTLRTPWSICYRTTTASELIWLRRNITGGCFSNRYESGQSQMLY